MTVKRLYGRLSAALMLCIFLCGCSWAGLKVVGVGQSSIKNGTYTPHELSGITYIGPIGSGIYRYLAVSNTQKTVYGMDVKINQNTGVIESASVVSALKLAEGTDLEGIAALDSGSFLVSDETGSLIRRYALADGSVTGNITMPAVLSSVRPNRSLEALSVSPVDKSVWTSNEEALTVDGNASEVGKTNTVRIMKFNSDFTQAGQWAYVVDQIDSAMFGKELSGVSDMAVGPDGTVLILERELDGSGLRSSIYTIDTKSATDISGFAELSGQTYTPAAKTLLWQKRLGLGDFNNYEGMCYGPKLKDGSYSLLLISDDNSNSLFKQSLYSLKVTGFTKS